MRLAALLASAAAATFASLASAAAVPAKVTDPKSSVSAATIKAAITCPTGLDKTKASAKDGVILLVHGTGSTGRESWGNGPYVTTKLGNYDVCWIDLPNRSMKQIAISGEYVAGAINYLAPRSATGKVKIVTHSQGGPDTQWALAFFPSTRTKVSHFVGNSPDFHGTNVLPFEVLSKVPYALSESLYQQIAGSHWQNVTYSKVFNTAYVPTLSVYSSLYDEVVAPYPATSTLSAGGKSLQASIQSYCPTFVADHYLMVIAQPAVALTASFFKTGKLQTPAQFNAERCTTYPDGSTTDFARLVPLVAEGVGADALTVATAYKAQGEPKLPSYVCKAGAAPASDCGTGYFGIAGSLPAAPSLPALPSNLPPFPTLPLPTSLPGLP